MFRTAVRLWLVLVLVYWTVIGYEYHDQLSGPVQRDWALAIQYGLNGMICDMGIAELCRDLHIHFWQVTQLNETFTLFVTIFGGPIALAVLLLLLLWAFKKPARRLTR